MPESGSQSGDEGAVCISSFEPVCNCMKSLVLLGWMAAIPCLQAVLVCDPPPQLREDNHGLHHGKHSGYGHAAQVDGVMDKIGSAVRGIAGAMP